MSRRAPGHVTVVLVNWNGREHLERCLPALAQQTYDDFDVVIVDNGSHDGSVEWLGRHWPAVAVLDLGRNIGFAAANNEGITYSHAAWIALLNNDTVPSRPWLGELMISALADPAVGSVASRMLFLDRSDVINSAGIAVDPSGIAWDRLGGAPMAAAEGPCDVFGASAGAALYRRDALEDAAEVVADGRREFFDARYFMYLEDVDLAWRLQLRRWRCVYAPGACVLHAGSGTAGEGSPFKNRLLARNKVWTVLKDYPAPGLARYWSVVLAYDFASAPYRVAFHGQTAALRGRLAALAGLQATLRRRQLVQRRRRATWSEIRAAMSALEPPWAVPRRYRHLEGRGGT